MEDSILVAPDIEEKIIETYKSNKPDKLKRAAKRLIELDMYPEALRFFQKADILQRQQALGLTKDIVRNYRENIHNKFDKYGKLKNPPPRPAHEILEEMILNGSLGWLLLD